MLGNAKVLSFALGNAKLPYASSFASQWNIGFNLLFSGHLQVISVVCNRFLDMPYWFFLSYQTFKKAHAWL